MDETDGDANRYFDRHVEPAYSKPGGAGCLDTLVLIWPIVFVVLALAIGTPLAIAVTSDTTSGARFAAFTALYGGLAAAYLTVIWGASYLAARAVSLWIGARRVLWIGFAGILMSDVRTGRGRWRARVGVAADRHPVAERDDQRSRQDAERALAIAPFSLCGMISSAIWKHAGR